MSSNKKIFNIVRNAKSNEATIDILAPIGESFFEEGYTMRDAKKDLQGITEGKIILNISSLGGLVHEGTTIHNMIKMNPATVEARIIGPTASMGTAIAMAGDEVTIADNAPFLIHNTLGFSGGNAKDHKSAGDSQDAFDTILVNSYVKQIEKQAASDTLLDEAGVKDLMDEDRWILPEEAEAFGLVDSVFEADASMAMAMVEEINGEKDLPRFTRKMQSTLKVEDSVEAKSDENPKEPKENLFKDFWKGLTDTIDNIKGLNKKEDPKEENQIDMTEFEAKAKELFDSMNKDANDELKADKQKLDDENVALEAKLEELTKAHTTLAAKHGHEVKIKGLPKVEDPLSDKATDNSLANSILNGVDSQQRAQLKNNQPKKEINNSKN